MAKGLGIGALVISILSIFLPAIGVFIAWIGLILASAGALAGDKAFAVSCSVIGTVNLLLLSPSVWLEQGGRQLNGGGTGVLLIISLFLIAAPLVCIFIKTRSNVSS